MRYGASIDAIQLQGFGQERPSYVDPEWTLQTMRVPVRSPLYDEVAAEVTKVEEQLVAQGCDIHGWDIPENRDGTFGPASIDYWGPPQDPSGPAPWAIVLGVAVSGTCLLGVGIALMGKR